MDICYGLVLERVCMIYRWYVRSMREWLGCDDGHRMDRCNTNMFAKAVSFSQVLRISQGAAILHYMGTPYDRYLQFLRKIENIYVVGGSIVNCMKVTNGKKFCTTDFI